MMNATRPVSGLWRRCTSSIVLCYTENCLGNRRYEAAPVARYAAPHSTPGKAVSVPITNRSSLLPSFFATCRFLVI